MLSRQLSPSIVGALVALGVLRLSSPGWAAPVISVNGVPLGNSAPVSRSGVTLVPLRPIFEALQCKVRYTASSQVIEATSPASLVIRLKLNQAKATVGNKSVSLAVPAQTIAGSTYVPLRFVAESLGAKVQFDNASGNIAVTASNTSSPVADTPPVVAPTSTPSPSTSPSTSSVSNVPAGTVATVPLVPAKPYTIKVPFEVGKDMPRLTVGNQGGILKIWDRSKKSVDLFRGIDDRDIARAAPAAHDDICVSLGIDPLTTYPAASAVMNSFNALPKKEAIALLGVLGSSPRIDATQRKNIQTFLVNQVSASDVILRRQAVLALAVAGQPSEATVNRVVNLFESSGNLWETFPVQQFFEYNAVWLRANPQYPKIRERVSKVESLYTSYLLGYLDGASVPGMGF